MQWFNRFRSQLNTNDGADSDGAHGAYLALWRKHRWMFIALLAAVVIGGGWMIQKRRPAMEALSGFVVPDPAAAVRQLCQRGLTARLVNGQVEVRQDQQHQAIAVLQQEHLLTADSSDAFDRMIEQQSIWTGERQKQREFLIAKAKMLSGIIGRMRDVRSAVVMLDLPQRRSFGPSRQRPSASVSVTMTTGVEVERNLVESIASLVSGAVTGMSPETIAAVINQFTPEVVDFHKKKSLEAAKTLCWENESKIMVDAYEHALGTS